MKLRQKIKQAKRELRKLEELEERELNNHFHFPFLQKKHGLTNLINIKRHLHSYTKDESILNGKLTYMELSCGMTKLFSVKNPTGKPLSITQQMYFNNHATQALLNYVPIVYEKYSQIDELPSDFYSIYTLYVSTDSSKSKKLFCKLTIYQFKNSQSLYILEDGKWIKIIDKD